MYNEINGDLHIRLIKLFKGINIDLLIENLSLICEFNLFSIFHRSHS